MELNASFINLPYCHQTRFLFLLYLETDSVLTSDISQEENSRTLSMISNSTDRSNKVDEIAAMTESNKAVMERLKRNEQPTPSGDYDDPGPAPMATLLVPG